MNCQQNTGNIVDIPVLYADVRNDTTCVTTLVEGNPPTHCWMIPSLLGVGFLLHPTRKFNTANYTDTCIAMQHGWWMMNDVKIEIFFQDLIV